MQKYNCYCFKFCRDLVLWASADVDCDSQMDIDWNQEFPICHIFISKSAEHYAHVCEHHIKLKLANENKGDNWVQSPS